ncbi:MAG: hypothetical protein J7L35_11460, partial [Anaerolineales bacterium]|nr:hypothetical protein [Anaerolineales bacterium]
RYFGRDQLRVEFAHSTRKAPVSSRVKPASGYRPLPKPAVRTPQREPSYQPLSATGRENH